MSTTSKPLLDKSGAVSRTLPNRSSNSYLPDGYSRESTTTSVTARFSRRSLAAIALEKTSSAFNNIASRGQTQAQAQPQPPLDSPSSPSSPPGSLGGAQLDAVALAKSSSPEQDRQSVVVNGQITGASGGAAADGGGGLAVEKHNYSNSNSNSNNNSDSRDGQRSSQDEPELQSSPDNLAPDLTPPHNPPLSPTSGRHDIEQDTSQPEPQFSAPMSGSPSPSNGKMHQTSSRLLRMTDDDKPFTRDFEDLFSTLMVSLKLEPHRQRFSKFDHSFTAEEAINNLGSLKFSQSNRMPDPKDPSRIVTTTTTTTFSMAKEMARSVCQRFVDARFIESVDGRVAAQFPLKGALFQLTPKGIHVLQRFCQRNGITARHIMDVLDSPRNTMQLVILERATDSDQLSQDRATIEVIFRRFAGQDGPNLKGSVSSSDSDSVSEYTNGIIGVKMAKERKVGDKVFQNSFTGKAAVDWLLDCCTTVNRRECFQIAGLFVKHGLITCYFEDRAYKQQDPDATLFQPTKYAIYGISDHGQRVCGWIAKDKSAVNQYDRTAPRDSNNARLNQILQDPALRLLFREFLRHSLCEENLSFYIDVSEFTANYRRQEKAGAFTKMDAVRETLASAYGLYNAFLAPGSPCELNIEHALRNSLAGRMTKAVGDDASMLKSLTEVVSLFEMAQLSVFKLMSSDSVPKFIRDPKYTAVLQEHDFDVNASGRAYSPTAGSGPERTASRSARS